MLYTSGIFEIFENRIVYVKSLNQNIHKILDGLFCADSTIHEYVLVKNFLKEKNMYEIFSLDMVHLFKSILSMHICMVIKLLIFCFQDH